MKTPLLLAFLMILSWPVAAAATKSACLKADKVTNQMAPPELYASYAACVKQKNYTDALFLFSLASAYGEHDKRRVPDSATHEVPLDILNKTLEKMTKAEQESFGNFLQEQISALPTLYPLCRKIFDVGPPMYDPVYMAGVDGKVLQSEEFYVAQAWLSAMGSTTRCPVRGLQLDNKTFKP
jgi:hypothetical protein